jgi:hypothetical protein
MTTRKASCKKCGKEFSYQYCLYSTFFILTTLTKRRFKVTTQILKHYKKEHGTIENYTKGDEIDFYLKQIVTYILAFIGDIILVPINSLRVLISVTYKLFELRS